MSQVETRTESKTKPIGRKARKGKTASEAPKQAVAAKPEQLPTPLRQDAALRLGFGALAFFAGLWAYWPTMLALVEVWDREPDYSHGYLVAPVAIYFLWARRASFPKADFPAYGLGLALVLCSFLGRYLGAKYFLEFVDGWSITFWLAGVVAIAGGRRTLWWALPSIGFLWFMVPLPFGVETAMSYPLQRIATKASCWVLQLLGQPAFAEGNVILLGENRLEVAQACSGLRLFVSVIALAYAYLVLVRRVWWVKGILLLAIAPIAVAANATRIVATGLMYQYTSGETAHKFAHDFAGWAMIPLAAALFALVLWYLGKLIREEEVMEMSALVRDAQG